jgi:hypothetical protein
MNLSTNKWQHDLKGAAHQALIIHQAMYQRRWCNMLGTASSINFKYINKEALIKIKFKINQQASHHHHKPSQRDVYLFHLTFHYTQLTSQNTLHFPLHLKLFHSPHSIGLHAQQLPLVRTHFCHAAYRG